MTARRPDSCASPVSNPSVRAPAPVAALKREDAARYVGLGTTTFLEMVRRGVMPKPRRYHDCNRVVWLIRELDQALEDLPADGADEAEADPWKDVVL